MQNCIFNGSVRQLADSLRRSEFVIELSAYFNKEYGHDPSPSEAQSWQNSLPELVNCLLNSGFQDFPIILEYRLPFDGERCDVVLLGSGNGTTKVLVLELKQWSNAEPYENSREIIEVSGIGPSPHPSYQASNYAGKLGNFHSLASELKIKACCYLHNMNAQDKSAKLLAGTTFKPLLQNTPIFFKDQNQELESFISEAIGPEPCLPDRVESFLNGTYLQSKQFFDGIIEHARDIADHVTASVIESGWGLSEEQLKLKNDAIKCIESGESCLFLVHGEPGSGKTLLAVFLFLELINTRKQIVMGLVNNRLMTALRSSLDKTFPGASGALKYFSPRGSIGIASAPSTQKFDVVICDEGQRMQNYEMPKILSRAPVVVVFYDDSQQLLPVEKANRVKLLETAGQLGLQIKEYQLSSNFRNRGGNAYQSWIEALLSDPGNTQSLQAASWVQRYSFRIFDTLQEMIDALGTIHQETHRDVCLLASFTESSGNAGEEFRTKKPPLRWAMKTEEYVEFWVNRGSNRLDRCASIFGCQGFERSYAGIIWGRDYAIRNGTWSIPRDHRITDYIGNPSLLKLVEKGRLPEALELLYNRYRVMLTRGIDGTFIYCEDPETRVFLKRLIESTDIFKGRESREQN